MEKAMKSADGAGLESIEDRDLAHHTALMFLPSWRARIEENAMETDHEPNAVKVDDLIIDEDTGEVLEMPDGVTGDLVEFLTFREVELGRGESTYKQARFLIKLAIKRELEKLDLKSLQTQHGRPVIRRRTTRKGKVERVVRVQAEYELSKEQTEQIMYCASALDTDRLGILSDNGVVSREAIEALIEEKTSEWLQVSPILKEPPVVEKI